MALAAVACSGSPPAMGPADDASVDASGVLPTGTCSLELTGAVGGARVGVAYAHMNGSGNLRVFCGSFSEASNEQLELDVGNGTYDGPRSYAIDQSHSDGDVTYAATGGAAYGPTSFAAACLVDLTTAPPGDYAPEGSTLAGTFSCDGLVDLGDPKGPTLTISRGRFEAPVR